MKAFGPARRQNNARRQLENALARYRPNLRSTQLSYQPKSKPPRPDPRKQPCVPSQRKDRRRQRTSAGCDERAVLADLEAFDWPDVPYHPNSKSRCRTLLQTAVKPDSPKIVFARDRLIANAAHTATDAGQTSRSSSQFSHRTITISILRLKSLLESRSSMSC